MKPKSLHLPTRPRRWLALRVKPTIARPRHQDRQGVFLWGPTTRTARACFCVASPPGPPGRVFVWPHHQDRQGVFLCGPTTRTARACFCVAPPPGPPGRVFVWPHHQDRQGVFLCGPTTRTARACFLCGLQLSCVCYRMLCIAATLCK